MSANSKNDIKTKAEVQIETKTKVQKVSSESSWCQWCVRIDGISIVQKLELAMRLKMQQDKWQWLTNKLMKKVLVKTNKYR